MNLLIVNEGHMSRIFGISTIVAGEYGYGYIYIYWQELLSCTTRDERCEDTRSFR